MSIDKSKELERKRDKLFKDGQLVQVHVKKWGMSCPLSAEDVGTTRDQLPSFVKLGKKMLINDLELSKFTAIESRARNYLKENSLVFPISQAHFIPNRKLISVLEKLHVYEEQFNAAVISFLSNYEKLKEDMLATFPNYREALEPNYPPLVILNRLFGFDLSIFEIAFPKKVEKTNLQALKAEAAAEHALQLKFEAEMEKQYQKSITTIDDFLKGSVQDLRGKIVTTFQHIAEKIRDGKIITKTNLDTMSGVISMFEGLNFLDDKSVQARLSEVKSLITTPVDFKTDRDAISALGSAIDNVLNVAGEVSDVDQLTGEYFRSITL